MSLLNVSPCRLASPATAANVLLSLHIILSLKMEPDFERDLKADRQAHISGFSSNIARPINLFVHGRKIQSYATSRSTSCRKRIALTFHLRAHERQNGAASSDDIEITALRSKSSEHSLVSNYTTDTV